MKNANVFYHAVLENAATGFLVVKADTDIVYANSYLLKELDAPSQIGNRKVCQLISDAMPTSARFQCANKQDCRNCVIRKSLDKMRHVGTAFDNAVFSHTVLGRAKKHAKWFLVSGRHFFYADEAYGILSFVNITRGINRERHLQQRLELDLSTNTLNKHSLLKKIKALTAEGNKSSFAICIIDFDGFKEINDRHGHVMGDEVLRTFSRISRKKVRATDIIGRYGGEEFVFVFPNTNLEEAVRVIIRIQRELKEHFGRIITYPISFSAGMQYVDKKEYPILPVAELISQVDKLLYRAKAQGKNRLVTVKEEYPFFSG